MKEFLLYFVISLYFSTCYSVVTNDSNLYNSSSNTSSSTAQTSSSSETESSRSSNRASLSTVTSSSSNSQTASKRSIYRPCPNFELTCIRDYFQKNAKCQQFRRIETLGGNRSEGSTNNSFQISDQAAYFINFGVAGIEGPNKTMQYDKAKITEFYVNSKTGKVVLSILFEGIRCEGPAKYLLYICKQEPTELTTYTVETYDSLETTTIFYGCGDTLSLAKSSTTGYVNSISYLDLGEGFRENRDSQWLETLNGITCEAALSTRQIYLTRSTQYSTFFIQKNICNFNLNYSDLAMGL